MVRKRHDPEGFKNDDPTLQDQRVEHGTYCAAHARAEVLRYGTAPGWAMHVVELEVRA